MSLQGGKRERCRHRTGGARESQWPGRATRQTAAREIAWFPERDACAICARFVCVSACRCERRGWRMLTPSRRIRRRYSRAWLSAAAGSCKRERIRVVVAVVVVVVVVVVVTIIIVIIIITIVMINIAITIITLTLIITTTIIIIILIMMMMMMTTMMTMTTRFIERIILRRPCWWSIF